MNTCFRCKGEKPAGQPYCESCRKKYDQARYQAQKDKRATQQKINKQRKLHEVYDYLLAHPCVDCGEADPIVLEFDHVRGTKVANVMDMINRRGFKEELAKCDVRCANCHTRITAQRANSWRLGMTQFDSE